jgi:hypothetical protein
MTSQPDDVLEAALLARMAASRTALLAARDTAKHADARRKPVSTLSYLSALVSDAPHVTLLAAIVAGALIFGPRHIVTVVVRNGLTAWIAKTVKRLAGR